MWARIRPYAPTVIGGLAVGGVAGVLGSFLVDVRSAPLPQQSANAALAEIAALADNAGLSQTGAQKPTILSGSAAEAGKAAAAAQTASSSATPPFQPMPRLERWFKRWYGEESVENLGWHLTKPHPIFLKHYDELLSSKQDEDQRLVLFPLCGASVDLSYLARRGHHVVGVEGVPKALDKLLSEYGEEIPGGGGLAPDAMRVRVAQPGWVTQQAAKHMSNSLRTYSPAPFLFGVQGDFLEFNADSAAKFGLGDFDAAFDRGGLVAVEPGDRPAYAANLASLVKPGGRLLLVTVEHEPRFGPPHNIDEKEVRSLFSGAFEVKLLSREDKLDAEPVWRKRGATSFHEAAYMCTRKNR